MVLAGLQNLAMAKLAGGWHMHGMRDVCMSNYC